MTKKIILWFDMSPPECLFQCVGFVQIGCLCLCMHINAW